MNNERRLSEREATKLSVKCWVMDKDYNPILLDYIPASCLNVSSGGMVLEWPLWWKCKGCSYGEKRNTELRCTVDKCQFENTNRFLVAATLLRVCIEEKKAEHVAKVVWIKEKEDCCHLGIAFPA
jgi:hypothetical protein